MNILSLKRPGNGWQWCLWHLGAGFAITAIPAQLMFGAALPALPPAKLPLLLGFAFAYALAATLVLWLTRGGRRIALGTLLLIGIAALGGWATFLLMTKVEFSRPLLLLSSALAGGSLLLSLWLPRGVQTVLGVLALLVTFGLQATGERPRELLVKMLDLGPKPVRSQATINTAYYSIQATFYDGYFNRCAADGTRCDTPRTGGALASFAGGFLYATGDGSLHFVADHPGARLDTTQLATTVPINSDAFLAGGGNERDLSVFRVMDILPREQGGRFELLAAHHYWDSARSCFVMRVSRLAGDTPALLAGEAPGAWQTVWDAEPCLPLKMNNGNQKQFGGDGAGGRMLLRGEHTLLVTIGDQQWDGWNWDHAVSQDPASAYGKIMQLDLRTGAATVFSSGMRNPEGFHEDGQGRLWSTEHGPQGGDELNLIVEGGNYGWPLMTYGNEYGTQDWPLRQAGADDDPALRRPVWAWLPSIGVSNLVSVRGTRFARWQGDLLICSFNASLQRAHIRDDRVVVLEPIRVRSRNGRLRDIVETADGRLVLLLDGGALAFLEPLDPKAKDPRTLAARGAMLFSACQQCHQVGDGTQHAVGPDLHGIVGRRVGHAEGFRYSDALASAGGEWSEERLDSFLRDPQQFAPGTAMQIRGLTDAADRAALIAHLKSLR